MNEYDISQAFKRIENELIDSLIRNLAKHRVDEEKEGMTWDSWQSLQLRELERYRKKYAHKFDGDFSDINNSIQELLKDSQEKGETEATIYSDILKEDFRSKTRGINEDRVNSLIEATIGDMEKAEHSVLRKANDEYRKIIFDAQMYADTGGTYEQAVDMATKDFLRRGINSIEYKNGARHNIESYTRMALRTGGKRAYLMGLGQQMHRVGIHTVRVNKRTDACPLCAKWLGKVLIDDVYAGGTKEEAQKKGLPTLSQAIDEGFLHPNCKDVYSMYIEGVSKKETPLTRSELDQMGAVYEAEQKLRQAQDTADSYRRMAKNTLDKEMASKYKILQKKWEDKVRYWEDYLGNLRKGNFMREALTEVPSIERPEIREPIKIERDSVIKGVFEVPDGVIELGEAQPLFYSENKDYKVGTFKLNKQIKLEWEGFGKEGQRKLGWNMPSYRVGKPVILQKNDVSQYWHDPERMKGTSISKWFDEHGYEYVGRETISKYNGLYWVDIAKKDGKYYVVFDELVEDVGTVKKPTIDKILEREKIVSKQLWDREVRFRDLTARRGDEWNKAMEVFHTVVEADKPVSLVTEEAYEKVKGEQLYRGIAPQSHIRGDLSMTKTPEECVVQLMDGGVGDCFPSRGIYGDGIAYASNSQQTALNYSGHGRGKIARFKIKDDARVIDYDDAVRLFEEIAEAHPNDGSPYFNRYQVSSRHEVGKAMQMLGYDVIYQRRGDGMDVHFYVILNRDALVSVAGDYFWEP